jgi:acyl-CoA thioesterase YciA
MPSIPGLEKFEIIMNNKLTELPSDRLPVIRVVAMPKDTNGGGSIFGGWIMSQIDIAAAIPALERAKGRVATVAVNSIEFHEPVFVGDVVSCYADIIKTGSSSITVKVEVYSERNPADKQIVKVTEAELTYVALDENRRPRPLPEVD